MPIRFKVPEVAETVGIVVDPPETLQEARSGEERTIFREMVEAEKVEERRRKRNKASSEGGERGTTRGGISRGEEEEDVEVDFEVMGPEDRCHLLRRFGIMWLAPFCHRDPKGHHRQIKPST